MGRDDRRRRRPGRGDDGEAVLTALAGAGLALALAVALGDLAGDVIDAARARTAADAAALAGVDGGRAGSDRLASANDAEVVAWSQVGDDVTVTVRVGDASATARASGAGPLDGS